MHPWAFVTPASRGIGRAIARRILSTTKIPVVATARKDTDDAKHEILRDLKDVDDQRLHVLQLDVLGMPQNKLLPTSTLTTATKG